MKKITIFLFVIMSVLLSANSKVLKLKAAKVELTFKNVGISKLSFSPGSEIIVEDKNDKVTTTSDKNKITFSADEFTKIKLTLPESKSYVYKTKKNSVCNFDTQQVVLKTEDGETLIFKDGNLNILDGEGESKVKIDAEGIFVNDDDSQVKITNKGIKIDSDDENKNIAGFWGSILGSVVTTIAKSSLSLAGKSPEKIMKKIINNKNGNFDIHFGDNGKEFSNEFLETCKLKSGGIVNVSNRNGAIKIFRWDKDFVDIYALKTTNEDEDELDKVNISVKKSHGGKNCDISTNYKERDIQVGVKYIIKVPASIQLGKIESSNGSMLIRNLQGNTDLETSNGSIKVEDFQGNLICRTSNGSVKLQNINGTAEVSTSNGSIKISQVDGIVSAKTSNGSITAEISKLDNDVEFSTVNGSINLYLAEDLNANIEASTSNSKVHVKDVKITADKITDNYLRGKIGNGGYLLKATTSNSSINIYKLSELNK